MSRSKAGMKPSWLFGIALQPHGKSIETGFKAVAVGEPWIRVENLAAVSSAGVVKNVERDRTTAPEDVPIRIAQIDDITIERSIRSPEAKFLGLRFLYRDVEPNLSSLGITFWRDAHVSEKTCPNQGSGNYRRSGRS